MTTKRVMNWRPGPMAERSTLKRALKTRTPKGDRFYKTSIVLDQGRSPFSAAYAFWHWLVIHDRSFVGIAPDQLAQLADPRLAERATITIEAIAGMLTKHGILAQAYWTRNVEHVRDALLQGFGPIVVGTPWLGSMMQPNAEGYIMAAGKSEGRHAYVIVGFDQERQAFRLLNSWGPSWGQLGRAWVRVKDLQLLLSHGEACVPVLASRNPDDRARWLTLLLQDRT